MTPEEKSEELSRKRTSIAALFETHFGRVARYIAVRIGDIAMAEDLASEVFVRALRSAENYKDTGAPMESWIFRIAGNLAIDHLRSMKRRPVPVYLDEHTPAVDDNDPEGTMIRQSEIEELNHAMQRLSEAQRQVLSLRFAGEMTSEQVAEVLSKSPGAIRQMQSDAVKKLRQLMVKPQTGQQGKQ